MPGPGSLRAGSATAFTWLSLTLFPSSLLPWLPRSLRDLSLKITVGARAGVSFTGTKSLVRNGTRCIIRRNPRLSASSSYETPFQVRSQNFFVSQDSRVAMILEKYLATDRLRNASINCNVVIYFFNECNVFNESDD